MKLLYLIILFISAVLCTSCADHNLTNRNNEKIIFANIESDYSLTDENNYGCQQIDWSVLKHILLNGTFITEKELHDQYSTTGCTIKGSVKINNITNEFNYDYGGIIFFSGGKILGCGENCCREDYPNCSWDKENLK